MILLFIICFLMMGIFPTYIFECLSMFFLSMSMHLELLEMQTETPRQWVTLVNKTKSLTHTHTLSLSRSCSLSLHHFSPHHGMPAQQYG